MPVLWLALLLLAGALLLLVLGHDTGRVAGMAAEDFSRLAGGAALLLVIGSGLVFSYRRRLGTALRHALVWLLAGVAAVAAYAFRDEAAYVAQRVWAELRPGYGIVRRDAGGATEVLLRRRGDGHFAADVAVNGRTVRMLVDTGASALTLTHEDARRVGLDPGALSYTIVVETANGRALVAQASVDSVAIGAIGFGPARALVARPGQLNESLLGIGILSRLDSYHVTGDSLVLRARPR